MPKLFYILIAICCFCSCSAQNNQEIPVMSEDIDQLKTSIQLDYTPVAARWIIEPAVKKKGRAPGPTDYKLTAVLTLSPDDWNALRQQHQSMSSINHKIYLANDFIKEWYSPEVQAELYLEEGFYRVTTDAYQSSKFSKSPLLNGFVFFADQNQVFVSMHTM